MAAARPKALSSNSNSNSASVICILTVDIRPIHIDKPWTLMLRQDSVCRTCSVFQILAILEIVIVIAEWVGFNICRSLQHLVRSLRDLQAALQSITTITIPRRPLLAIHKQANIQVSCGRVPGGREIETGMPTSRENAVIQMRTGTPVSPALGMRQILGPPVAMEA